MTYARLCEHKELKTHPIEKSGFFKLGDCPGGEFLPEDVLVINRSTAVQIIADQEFTVQERQGRHLNGFWHYLTEEEVLALLAALDASQVGEPG